LILLILALGFSILFEYASCCDFSRTECCINFFKCTRQSRSGRNFYFENL